MVNCWLVHSTSIRFRGIVLSYHPMSSSVVAEAVEKSEDALANAFSTSHYWKYCRSKSNVWSSPANKWRPTLENKKYYKVWKFRNFSATTKILREINFRGLNKAKIVIWRHLEETLWKFQNFLLLRIYVNLVLGKIQPLKMKKMIKFKSIRKCQNDDNFWNLKIDFTQNLCGRKIVQLSQSTVWKNEKFSLTKKKISSNQLFSNFFSKTIAFTKF